MEAPSLIGVASETPAVEEEVEKGPNNGRLLKEKDFVVELSIFETGVPPEFRVWVTKNGQAVRPEEVSLKVTLTRLGGLQDNINFRAEGDFLRGDMVVYEPHSFIVSLDTEYKNQSYHWQYDNFEGRTTIEPQVAEALEIKTSIAGPTTLKETISVYGKLVPHPDSKRNVHARFDGLIKKSYIQVGQTVKKGQKLFTIESNESLKNYDVLAPISGVILARSGGDGEQTNNRVLASITNTSLLMSEMAVFPSERHLVKIGAKVTMKIKGSEIPITAVVYQIDSRIQPNQSIIVRADVTSADLSLVAGSFLSGEIEIAEHQVQLAVKRAGLQAFRDFTVVFVKIGNEYEVRMLELGRVAGEWVEVLGGLKPGSEYVSLNSYIIKADIEKTGATHDH
jgi:cobalt-zinc-cadmium efflux system membrane fusion protein